MGALYTRVEQCVRLVGTLVTTAKNCLMVNLLSDMASRQFVAGKPNAPTYQNAFHFCAEFDYLDCKQRVSIPDASTYHEASLPDVTVNVLR